MKAWGEGSGERTGGGGEGEEEEEEMVDVNRADLKQTRVFTLTPVSKAAFLIFYELQML